MRRAKMRTSMRHMTRLEPVMRTSRKARLALTTAQGSTCAHDGSRKSLAQTALELLRPQGHENNKSNHSCMFTTMCLIMNKLRGGYRVSRGEGFCSLGPRRVPRHENVLHRSLPNIPRGRRHSESCVVLKLFSTEALYPVQGA